jgi:hypothetical protein
MPGAFALVDGSSSKNYTVTPAAMTAQWAVMINLSSYTIWQARLTRNLV